MEKNSISKYNQTCVLVFNLREKKKKKNEDINCESNVRKNIFQLAKFPQLQLDNRVKI